jgi:putative transposase
MMFRPALETMLLQWHLIISELFLPIQYSLLVFAGWVNRRQMDYVAYLKDENRILREVLGEKRLRFTDAQHRQLAKKAKRSSRKMLSEIGCLVTPDTLLA